MGQSGLRSNRSLLAGTGYNVSAIIFISNNQCSLTDQVFTVAVRDIGKMTGGHLQQLTRRESAGNSKRVAAKAD